MIHFLGMMQAMFGRHYPLFASAVFATTAVYYSLFVDTPDKVLIVSLAFFSSLGWMCLYGAENILFDLVESMEKTVLSIEEMINRHDD